MLKGLPPPEMRGDSKAGPSLSCEEGEWAVGALGAGLLACRLEFQPCSVGLAGDRPRPSGLAGNTPHPCKFPQSGKMAHF